MGDDTNRAIFQAVFGPVREPWPLLEPDCPSGECTWPLFSSMAVCVSMENVTDHLEVSSASAAFGTRLNHTASLLNDTASVSVLEDLQTLQMVSPEPESSVMDDAGRESLAFGDQPHLLNATFSQFFFIYNIKQMEATRASFRAVELLWHFCVNTYKVSVSEGRARTDVVASRTYLQKRNPMPALTVDDYDDEYRDPPVMRFDVPEGREGDGEFYVRDGSTVHMRLGLDMGRAFSGTWGPWMGTDMPYSEANRQFGLKIFPSAPEGRNLTAVEADELTWDGIRELAQAMADSMTNHFRGMGDEVQGTVLLAQTFVVVRWAWLAFLSAQVGLSIVFMALVVAQTARLDVDVVKSSALAGVFAVSGRMKTALEVQGQSRGAWGFSVGNTKTAPGMVSQATARLERDVDDDGEGWSLAVWPGEQSEARESVRKRRVRQSVQQVAVSNHQSFT